jgi:hypothetical protein
VLSFFYLALFHYHLLSVLDIDTLAKTFQFSLATYYDTIECHAYQVAEAITNQNNLLDLSSQLTATGVASEPKTTTYTLKAGATTLTEGEDYQVVEPGKFQFLKSQAEPVHVEMATDAFPKFKNANAYVTTDFTVTITAEN